MKRRYVKSNFRMTDINDTVCFLQAYLEGLQNKGEGATTPGLVGAVLKDIKTLKRQMAELKRDADSQKEFYG